MTHSTATRRLVKSPPELWAEVSSEESLGRRLAEFGEIRITGVEPETTVAWEGDRASGTVELAPTGWGTKVVLTAQACEQPGPPPAVAEVVAATPPPAAPQRAELRRPPDTPAAQPAPERVAARPAPEPRRGFLARLFRRRPPAPAVATPSAGIPGPPLPAPDPSPPSPAPDPGPLPPAPDPGPPAPAPEPPAPQIEVLDPARTAAILDEVLDDLGAAHHRPFSRD